MSKGGCEDHKPGRSVVSSLSSSDTHVGHVVASINAMTGGPAVSVTQLCRHLQSKSVATKIFSLDYEALGSQLIPEGVVVDCPKASLLTRRFRGFNRELRKLLSAQAATQLSLIHNHGLWMFPNWYARQAAEKANIPLVISPRGMLEPWAQERSRWRKLLAWHIFEKRNLRYARLFHATSEAEAQSIRRKGFRQPIALIPNGVEIPDRDLKPAREHLERHFPRLRGKRYLLFMSRLHPKKGLDLLTSSWASLHASFPQWHLLIAGGDWESYRERLTKVVLRKGIDASVSLSGPLDGRVKEAALLHADLFVLPSFSENFGIVVAESLVHGVPVITTKGTPWKEVITHQCGWWIEASEDSLKSTLTEAMNLSSELREEMGERGRSLVSEKYTWPRVAEQMAGVYRWVLGSGDKPVCVLESKNVRHPPPIQI